jgi:hypothetical protein
MLVASTTSSYREALPSCTDHTTITQTGPPFDQTSPLNGKRMASYPLGPECEVCTWKGGHTRILWLLPITRAEKDFRREGGLEALESLFDEHAIDPVDPRRASVV